MATQMHRPSAEIYAFPAGGRAGRGGQRPAARPVAQQTPALLSTGYGSWYHQAAVEEAERTSALERPARPFTDFD